MARALVVEDDSDIASLITHYLERDGWRCDLARDGLEALSKLGTETYRLVVLDLQLPGKDGLSVLTQPPGARTGRPVSRSTRLAQSTFTYWRAESSSPVLRSST